ncbi:MAG: 2-amino-4-hydroxy-6-hydroxymethyldihydropteridine diphosphokinase [Peptococcaceae bacterium]|jgi:2-amino-4-hydroxy-6-hydroxymethyldihydropteridine diphosphokinase|nr:2-amino-4-hydroxy-6-hydroxymethyldihydropteridine diphosphokinase [Peptococcaceae bacterium]
MGVTAYIGLGTNLGDTRANLRQALESLRAKPGIEVRRVASFYRTEPQGYPDQDWFLNTVAGVETGLRPLGLLSALQGVEAALGRVRSLRWGPRVIDLDLLLYGEERINSPVLTVPHPRLMERAFVLVPLAELEPDLELAPGVRAAELAARLAGEQAVERVE